MNTWSALFGQQSDIFNHATQIIRHDCSSTPTSINNVYRSQTAITHVRFFCDRMSSIYLQMALNDPKSCRLYPIQSDGGGGGGGGHRNGLSISLFLCPFVLRSSVRHTLGVPGHLQTNHCDGIELKFGGWTHYSTSSAYLLLMPNEFQSVPGF